MDAIHVLTNQKFFSLSSRNLCAAEKIVGQPKNPTDRRTKCGLFTCGLKLNSKKKHRKKTKIERIHTKNWKKIIKTIKII